MNCNELHALPDKMANLGENTAKSRRRIREEKLDRLLNDTADALKKQGQYKTVPVFFNRLNLSFRDILSDPAINDWDPHEHKRVRAKCERLLELCVCKMDHEDSLRVLEGLAILFDPKNKFHTFNATRISQSVSPGSDIPDENLYARPPPRPSSPQGWLVDLMNRFGELGGFIILLSRFQRGRNSLTIPEIYGLLRPFRLCQELLTVDTIVKYLIPVLERVREILNALTDNELMEAAKFYTAINHGDLSGIIATMEGLVSRVPGHKEIIKNLESLKVRLIFKLVQSDRDINEPWVKFNLDLSREQWDNVFQHFQTSWDTANDNVRVKLLKLLQQWAKDYEAVISHRILTLFWDLAHSYEISTEILEQMLSARVKILQHLSPQARNDQIFIWLDKCVEEVKSSDIWTVPALKHIHEIFNMHKAGIIDSSIDKDIIIQRLDDKHSLMNLFICNLTNYLDKVRQLVKSNPRMNRTTFMPDGRYNHETQVLERLKIVKILSEYGDLWLGISQINIIWQHLLERPIFNCDRVFFFDWLSPQDLNPTIIKDFFKQSILHLDPSVITEIEIACFDEFFQYVNYNANTLDNFIAIDYLWRVVITSEEDVARHGFKMLQETFTRVGANLQLPVSEIRRTFIGECTNQLQIYSNTFSRFTVIVENSSKDNDERKKEIEMGARKIDRVMKFLREYINECGWGED